MTWGRSSLGEVASDVPCRGLRTWTLVTMTRRHPETSQCLWRLVQDRLEGIHTHVRSHCSCASCDTAWKAFRYVENNKKNTPEKNTTKNTSTFFCEFFFFSGTGCSQEGDLLVAFRRVEGGRGEPVQCCSIHQVEHGPSVGLFCGFTSILLPLLSLLLRRQW